MINENYETEVLEKLTIPYIVFPQQTLAQKKILARQVSILKEEELFLASPIAFTYEGFVAGLSFEQIVFFMKNAPMNYKKELFNAFSDEQFMTEVMEIAKDMDDDFGANSTQNQKRIKSIYRYFLDNQAALMF